MKTLQQLLLIPIAERTAEDWAAIEEKMAEATDEQKTQIEAEKAEIKRIEDEALAKADELLKEPKKYTKDFNVDVKDLGEGELEAVIASDIEDRHGERIDISGMDIKKYMMNPVVAWGHNYDEFPIAQTLNLKKIVENGKTKIVAKMKFAIQEYEKARTAYALYKGGFLRAFSIGFIAKEVDRTTDVWVYTKSEMIEFSGVLIPANPEALALAKQRGINVDILGKKAIDKKTKTSYDGLDMNLAEILKKLREQGADALTGAELKFLKSQSSEVSEADKKEFASIFAKEESIADQIKTAIKEAVEPISKELETIKGTEKTVMKNISVSVKQLTDIHGKEIPKEEIFKLWVKGMTTNDFSDYKSAMEAVGKSAMTDGNTGAVLPPTEFVAEVLRLEESYGVARRNATLRRTTRTSITVILGDDDVQVFDTAEAGVKRSTKLSYTPQVLTFRKFAAILPITDELLEDSAIDLWNDASQRFARAYARQEDELVFTDATSGLLNIAGTVEISAGHDSFEEMDADDLNRMIYAVPSGSSEKGKFYFHRTILGVIQRMKDENGQYIWSKGINGGEGPTIWNKGYELTEVMPSLDDDDSDTPFVIFGDLKYVTLGERTTMQAKIFDAGNVGDPDDEEAELNLLTQDMQAMRVVKRMNAKVRFPGAFSILVTGPHGS